MNKKVEVSHLVYVHTMPEWLQQHLQSPSSDYYAWARDYERLIEGRNLWRIWMIDVDFGYWLEVNYINDHGQPEFNTIKLEPNTFSLIETEPYETLTESDV